LAGESAGLIHSVESVEKIITDTVAQFQAIAARMGKMAQDAAFG